MEERKIISLEWTEGKLIFTFYVTEENEHNFKNPALY